MSHKQTVLIGKAVQRLAALRGGGSALPGLVVEKLDKDFMARCLAKLPHGVVLITGTNGKTTTTKMVTALLGDNLRVLTNKTGSNFTRGIVSALLSAMDKSGKLPYDIAVLELDEAHAIKFINQVKPNFVLVLNVMRDQLDRFGEIDYTARLVQKVAASAVKGVVLNKDDPRVAAIAKTLQPQVDIRYFSVSNKFLPLFVNDDALHGKMASAPMSKVSAQLLRGDVMLHDFKGQMVSFLVGNEVHKTRLQLSGIYNFLNAAGALALAKLILGSNISLEGLMAKLATVKPAFGRGEVISIGDSDLEIILVKNPAGFRLSLESITKDADTMIAINDAYADGRDMSWLWDVDFQSLKITGVKICSGVRAYDMALRLQYDNIEVGLVEADLKTALSEFLKGQGPKRIFCTYTAMLAIRRLLKKDKLL